MQNAIDYKKSFWRSSLFEFCEEVLTRNRKKNKLTQQRIALLLGLNQSEVSRIERGVTIPKDIITIEAVCEIYKLTPSEKQKYLELACGLPKPLETDTILDLIDTQTNFIANLNRSGSPSMAINQSEGLREWIENNIDHTNIQNNKTIDRVCHLLLEESAAWWDIVIPKEVHQKTNNLIQTMENFTNVVNNHANIYLSINKGFHAYILGDYQKAKEYFEKVVLSEYLEKKLWGYEVLRAYTVTLGKLKGFTSLIQIENKIFKLVHDTAVDDTQKGYLLEGLGQAYVNLDIKKSQTFFDAAFNHINEARTRPGFLNIRYVQLTRSYLLLLRKLASQHDVLLSFAAPALKETEKSGFVRHQQQILQLINI